MKPTQKHFSSHDQTRYVQTPTQGYEQKVNAIREWAGRMLHEWSATENENPEVAHLYVTGKRGLGNDDGADWDIVLGITTTPDTEQLEAFLRNNDDGCNAVTDPIDPVVVSETEALNEAFSMAWHGGYETVYDGIRNMLIPVET